MSKVEPKTERRAIQLQWDGGAVTVTPADQDRFVKSSQWAVDACQNQLMFDKFLEQFKKDFLRSIRDWCEGHSGHILACFVPVPPSGHPRIFVISRSSEYNFDLSDSLTDLENELANKGWPANVLQLPSGSPESLATFFDEEHSVQVYGERG